jgi:carbon-monoxide dehydrogenase small subunit
MPNPIAQTLSINGAVKEIRAYPLERLLDVLRDRLHLTGTKEGCGEGECGACSVFIDDKLVNSCLVPFIQCKNRAIDTIESKFLDPILSTVQESFLAWGGAQCGFCTPGMIMAAVQLLRENSQPTASEINESLSGNLCRCTGYTKIVASIQDAAQRLKEAL